MKAHRAATDIAWKFVPVGSYTFLMRVRRIIPVAMELHSVPANIARIFVPTGVCALDVCPWRIGPPSMDPHLAAAHLAVLCRPSALAVKMRDIVPILAFKYRTAAVITRNLVTYRHTSASQVMGRQLSVLSPSPASFWVHINREPLSVDAKVRNLVMTKRKSPTYAC